MSCPGSILKRYARIASNGGIEPPYLFLVLLFQTTRFELMTVHHLLLLTPMWIVAAVRFLFQGPAHSRTYERGWALTTELLVVLLIASLGERWLEVTHKGVLFCCIAVASVRDVCCRARVRCSSTTSCFDVGDSLHLVLTFERGTVPYFG